MRIPRIVAAVVATISTVGCGGGTGGDPAAAPATVAAAEDEERSGGAQGLDAIEDLGLVVMRVATADLDAAEATFDAHGDIDGWMGSYDYGGGAEATLTFEPHAEDLEAAARNKETVRAALESLGTVTEQPHAVVLARFSAAPGSPLDRDALTASDAFDDLAGCDWDGGALMADHVWYCESALDDDAAATARAAFAERAGIEPSAITLTLYR